MKRKILFLIVTLALYALGAAAQTQVPIASGAVSIDVSLQTNFLVILNQNVTGVTLLNQRPAEIVSILFTQNGTGGYTVTFGGNISSSNLPTISTTANATTYVGLQFSSYANTWYSTGAGGGGGGGVSSFTGDGALSNNSASTGAVTFSLATAGAYNFWGNATGSTAAPGYSTIPLAALPSGVALLAGGNTVTGLQNLASATLGLPVAASYAPTTAGLFGYDSTNNRLVVGNGTNTSFPTYITTAPTSGHCANFSGTLGLLADSGAACGFANPMTTLGDVIYGGASGAATRLAGPTGVNSVPQTLVSTPSAGAATAPTWAPAGVVPNPQTGTTYTYVATDRAEYTTFSNASAIAVTLPAAGSTGFASNWVNVSCDIGAGTATITPATSTISYSDTGGATYTSAASTMTLAKGQCASIYTDNTNYFAIRYSASGASASAPFFGTSLIGAASGGNSVSANGATGVAVILGIANFEGGTMTHIQFQVTTIDATGTNFYSYGLAAAGAGGSTQNVICPAGPYAGGTAPIGTAASYNESITSCAPAAGTYVILGCASGASFVAHFQGNSNLYQHIPYSSANTTGGTCTSSGMPSTVTLPSVTGSPSNTGGVAEINWFF